MGAHSGLLGGPIGALGLEGPALGFGCKERLGGLL